MDLSPLLAALEILMLERLPQGTFVRRGPLPQWSTALSPPQLRDEQPFDLEAVFPFLGAFLEQAEVAWRGGAGSRATSEFWTELGAHGEEIHLEASAVQLGSIPLLAIAQNNRLFVQQQLMLQRARELRLVHDALMREFEHKDILMHAIVHDLASPLHTILGALSLLDEQSTGEPGKRWIQIGLQAAMRQRQLVQEILDVFIAEKSGLDLMSPRGTDGVEVAGLVDRVTTEMEPMVRQRNVRLVTQLQSRPERVVAEEKRLFRVLTNLLDNALSGSPDGGSIWLSSRREDGTLLISVEDQGQGVPIDLLPRLFQKFARAGSRQGTGLGLYFCRITVESWGGGIGYEPRAEGGARFWIRLPVLEQSPSGAKRGRAAAH